MRETREVEPLEHLDHPPLAVLPRPAAETKADVPGDRQMRKQRVALEDVADPPLLRRQIHAGLRVEQHAVVDDHAPGVGLDQAREALERQRLAGTRGSEQHGDTVARRPRDVQGETRQPLRDLDRETMLHAALAPRRPARISTTHESAVSASTSATASPISPVCTAV